MPTLSAQQGFIKVTLNLLVELTHPQIDQLPEGRSGQTNVQVTPSLLSRTSCASPSKGTSDNHGGRHRCPDSETCTENSRVVPLVLR